MEARRLGILFTVGWLALAAAGHEISRATLHPLGWGEAVWAGFVLVAVVGALVMVRRFLPEGQTAWWEYARLGTLIYAACWLFGPLASSRLIGGVDARWYGYVMIDALEQARTGVWPVFVGQGEFMFNGAIHPYRTAPYYINSGIVLDLATCRILTPLMVQHLVVLITTITAALVSYACLVSLLPRLRWLACGLALLYVSAPTFGEYIYGYEMYMTFTTLAWMPLVAYGNVRLFRNNDAVGWCAVVAGLALVWYGHAPVGSWATMFTADAQGLRLLARDDDVSSWRRGAVAAACFAGLVAYLFLSVGESRSPSSEVTPHFGLYVLALGMGLVSLIRLLVSGRAAWLAVMVAACAAMAWARPQHAVLLGLAVIVALGYRVAVRRKPAWGWQEWFPLSLALILLACALLATVLLPEPAAWRANLHSSAANFVLPHASAMFGLLTESPRIGNLQPGYSALALLAVALVVVVFNRTWELLFMVVAALLLLTMLLPVPGLHLLLYSLVPDAVYAIGTGGLWMRFMPLLAVLLLFAGALALGQLAEGRRRWLRMATIHGLMGAALFWNLTEIRKPMSRGVRYTDSESGTQAFYRTDMAALYYAYDGLPRPTYLVNGIVDYRLESRLLDSEDKRVLPDPLLAAAGESVSILSTRPNPAAPSVYELRPELSIPPGERVLVRFEFFDKVYDGYLDVSGEGFRRIYYLPDSGFLPGSFGVAASRPKVLAFWNTASSPLALHWSYNASTPPAEGKPFGDFARVSFRLYRPDELQIKPRGLIPYRAEVSLEKAAYLETPRVFIPGYRATVNGREVPVEKSPEQLAMIRLEPGRNDVVIAYRGTPRLWTGFAISLATFASGLVWVGRGLVQALGRLRQPAAG